MLWPKKIHTRNLTTKKIPTPRTPPPPHTFSNGPSPRSRDLNTVVYHLPQIPGNSCWDVNDKRFFWFVPVENPRDKTEF